MKAATIAATRQVVDIPLPIMATIVNHLQMQVKCTCGHCCKGRFPESVNALVSNMLNAMRKLSKTPYEMIRRKVAAGKVSGADETGVNVNGRNSWLWAFQNAAATCLAFDRSRGHDVVNKNFSPEEQGGTVWVTDRWPTYFMGDVGMEDHQHQDADNNKNHKEFRKGERANVIFH